MKVLAFRILATAALVAASSLSAHAGTLNFSGLPFSNGSPLVLSNATLTNLSGTTILVGAAVAGASDGFCFASGGCQADGTIDFVGPVSNLNFDIDGWESGDFVAITAFNGVTSLGTINATANGNLNFASFGAITRLFFDDSSTSAGVAYSTFSFTQGGTTVPEPGTMALVGLALLGAVASRRAR